MQFKRRQLLVLLLIVGQLGCMSFGVLWASKWLGSAFQEFVERSSAAQGRSIADELARRISDREIKEVNPGTTGWQRLQKLCERIEPPHDGFVAVIHRSTGALICHSGLKDDPTLLRKFPGRSVLVTRAGVAPLIEAARHAEVKTKSPAFGEVEVAGQLFQATCLSLPKINAVLAVYQSQVSIDRSVTELVTPVLQVGFILTAAVVGASGLLTVFLVKRFDNTLSLLGDSVEREVERRTLSLTRSRNAVVFGLAKLAESRDKDAGQHLERIRTYVTILASEMAKHNPDIDHHYVANLAIASVLHDIGKMGVPDGVILKLGKLTPAERRAMQMHTVLGGECLASVERMFGDHDAFLDLGREIALAHHEQWDGSGYPQGLQGKQIPLSARIVALADVYDALTSHRAYRPAVCHAEAREWIVTNYGSQFDPEVIEAFVAREHDFAKISAVAFEQRMQIAAAPRAVDDVADAASVLQVGAALHGPAATA
jgi:HD-GYP domain-containing protein (c-di-GMP phosphodiesterase class II)